MVIARREFIKRGLLWLPAIIIGPRIVEAGFDLEWFEVPSGSGCAGYEGITTLGATNGTSSSLYASKFTMSGNCSVNYMEVYCRSGSPATGVLLGLYDDNGGAPNNKLASVAEFSPGSDAWTGGALSTTVSLYDSTDYHLAMWGTDGSLYHKYDTGTSGDSHYKSGSDPLPDPFGSSTAGDRLISMRLSYV